MSFLLFSRDAYSQKQVIVRLKTPPPNQLTSRDLWSLTLRNATRQEMRIYLTGTASEEKDGLLVEGRSKFFILPPGERSYGYNDFKNGSATWHNRKYEETIVRTGGAPSGSYTFCVTAFNEDGEVVGQENCIQHQIEILNQQEIILLQPGDGEKISSDDQLTFTWAPITPAPKDGYSLTLTEILGNQSPREALKKNRQYFEEKRIRPALLSYPLTAQKLKPDTRYAWRVYTVESGKEVLTSEIFTFVVTKADITQQSTEKTGISGDSCTNIKSFLKKIPNTDKGQYKVLITNKLKAPVNNQIPSSLKISVKADSNFTVPKEAPKQWKREVVQGNKDTTTIIWKHESGAIPPGEIELDEISFGQNIRGSATIRYDWLDKAGAMICTDSVILGDSRYYIELNNEYSQDYVQLTSDFLNIQYFNSYASSEELSFAIFDIESLEIVPLNQGSKQERYKNVNGLNRISLQLSNFNIQPDKIYLLMLTDAKNTYYLNFAGKKNREN